MSRILTTIAVVFSLVLVSPLRADDLKVGVFNVDASPPVGSPLAYDPTEGIDTPLSCRGIVILGAELPIVLCAIDWIGIANEGQTVFREQLAAAAGTTPERVAVHALHQHDAPIADFTLEDVAAQYGLSGVAFDPGFARSVVRSAADALTEAVENAEPVTHIGLGEGRIEKVASNRRILGPDGTVLYVRWTATGDPEVRAFPEGVIDPDLKMIAFFNEDQPLVALTYYATHPQSYYRTGLANPDFPGLARNAREAETGVPHVHFNGAGGNIGAGKYNDGSPENRQILADRVAAGMVRAWNDLETEPITFGDVDWESIPVLLPIAERLDEAELLAILEDEQASDDARIRAARKLIWLRRGQDQDPIDISCLTLGRARVLHMPGELFVEYQLAAQEMRPDLFICMAAYGDYAPAYIGTAIAYEQGGYETPGASLVSPEVEEVLISALQQLLDAPGDVPPLGVEAAERETAAARERASNSDR